MANLNQTPQGERTHISLFGRRNIGKSSLINALAGQNVAIVSEVKGTTTDPVSKAMELLPLGPVLLTDTPGLDDEGMLGELRMQRTIDVLNKTDLALLVIDAEDGIGSCETELIARFQEKKLPYLLVINKSDLHQPSPEQIKEYAAKSGCPAFAVSSQTSAGVDDLKKAITKALPDPDAGRRLIGDLLSPNDVVVLVTPIDAAAPKGRLILPQQQVIRDILESNAIAIVTKEFQLKQALASLAAKPRMVVTDSQVFAKVAADTPEDIPLTSFSMLFARYKGDLTALVDGAKAVEQLKDGDRILMAEGCTHHRQDDDIGTKKIPHWLLERTGKKLTFDHTSGIQYARNLKDYALIVHCGACMLNRREMLWRIQQAKDANVPIVNYGILIAALKGILPRSLAPLIKSN